jgi:hypothetical protein
VAEYIAAPARAKLERAGVSYADATGWVRIVSDDPMLAITAVGAAKSPKPDRVTGAITRLDGRSAGRIARARSCQVAYGGEGTRRLGRGFSGRRI